MISDEALKKIKVLIFDCDGVLTDGTCGYGLAEPVKFFNYKDGQWLRMAMRAGFKVGILSGKGSPANRRRAEELQLSFIYENKIDKLSAFEELLKDLQITPEECLYAGDDVLDYPVMSRVGVAVAVKDAVAELDEVANWRLQTAGGRGVAVEIVRRLLQAHGVYDSIMEKYRR